MQRGGRTLLLAWSRGQGGGGSHHGRGHGEEGEGGATVYVIVERWGEGYRSGLGRDYEGEGIVATDEAARQRGETQAVDVVPGLMEMGLPPWMRLRG